MYVRTRSRKQNKYRGFMNCARRVVEFVFKGHALVQSETHRGRRRVVLRSRNCRVECLEGVHYLRATLDECRRRYSCFLQQENSEVSKFFPEGYNFG